MKLRSAFLLTLAFCRAPAADAQLNLELEALEGVGIEQKLDAQVPLELMFRDEKGTMVRVGQYFDSLPVLVTLNFSDCPQLCHVQLDQLTDGLREIDLSPGKDFRILTISIDPLETPQRAAQTKKKYVERYMRPEAAEGWHFLTGTEANIRAFADAVGFSYKYVNDDVKYAHPPAAIFITPKGRIARYLNSVGYYEPTNLRFSLIEAGDGKIGGFVDQFFLNCFYYNAEENRYVLFATNFMKLGALVTVLALAIFWLRMRRFERSRSQNLPMPEAVR